MSNQELIRRKRYCQIVKEIAGSDQYMIVGIDIGKDKHHASLKARGGPDYRNFPHVRTS